MKKLTRLLASIALLASACNSGTKQNGGPGAEPQDADVAQAPAVSAAASPEVRTADSAEVFDPDGYFLPTEAVAVRGYQLSSLQLNTVEYFYGGELHYDRPRLLDPTAVIRLGQSSTDGLEMIACDEPSISPDRLVVRCRATPVGDITIEGAFTDKRGRFWNILEYELTPTVALAARVRIELDGVLLYDAQHEFSYAAGH